jgi:hypothetical protein
MFYAVVGRGKLTYAQPERHVPVAATRVPLDMTQSSAPLRLLIWFISDHFLQRSKLLYIRLQEVQKLVHLHAFAVISRID